MVIFGGFATSADPVKELRGGGLRGPGESWGALPGTSGALRGSPGELSLGARGRRFGSSGGVPGRAFQEVFSGAQTWSPTGAKKQLPAKEVDVFWPFPDPPATPTATGRNSAKNVVHLPPTSRQNPGSGASP